MYILELVGEDDAFASYEAACCLRGVQRFGPGVATASALTDRADQLAYTRRIDEFLVETPLDPRSASAALREAAISRSGPVAVRARAIRGAAMDTQRMERRLGDVLVDRGFAIDLETPEQTLRALGTADRCVLAWELTALDHGFSDRAPTDRPFFRPGAMAPRLARAIVNIAGAGPGVRVCDPLCGTGGFLIEAGLIGATPVGGDVDGAMVAGARRNVSAICPHATVHLVRADATAQPLRADRIDTIVTDAPYGRQSRIAERAGEPLLPATLAESARVANTIVLVSDRPLDDEPPADWELHGQFRRRVHRSLDRYIHLLGPADAFPSPVPSAA